MADRVPPETPAERGQKSVEREVTASGASQVINKEINDHLGDTKGNKEFLQAASAELQTRGLLPEMAVDFGKKHFKELDTDKDGYASEAEIRRALQKGQDGFTPAERLAGNFLADQVADSKKAMSAGYKGFASTAELDNYLKEANTKYGEFSNGQAVLKAFGNDKDFAALDTDKNGYVSTAEMKEKLAYNDRRLGEEDIGGKTKDKFEKENKALKYMLEHQSEMSKGNGTWTSSQLTLGSIREYAGSHSNPGQLDAQYKVTDDMVRGSSESEAKAVAAREQAAAMKAAQEQAAMQKAAQDKAALEKAAEEAKRKEEEDGSKTKYDEFKKLLDKIGGKPEFCKPGDPNCQAGPVEGTEDGTGSAKKSEQNKVEPKVEPQKDKTDEQPTKIEPPKDKVEEPKAKPQESEEQVKKAPEKQLSEIEKNATAAGAYTLDTVAKAYADAKENGKGVAMMIVGENTPGSKELMAKLSELQRQNPNLNFVVVDKDQVNKSSDPSMAPWKSWVAQSATSDYALTSVQSIKTDAKGVASPDKVISTHWGANIEDGLKDQSRYASDATKRNVGAPRESSNPGPLPEAPKPDSPVQDDKLKRTDYSRNRTDVPTEIQYANSRAELDAAIQANAERGLPTIIDVTRSHGCPNCDNQNPILKEVGKDFPGQIIKVDADSALGSSLSVRGTLPQLIVQNRGGQRIRYQGPQSAETVRRALSTR